MIHKSTQNSNRLINILRFKQVIFVVSEKCQCAKISKTSPKLFPYNTLSGSDTVATLMEIKTKKLLTKAVLLLINSQDGVTGAKSHPEYPHKA